MSELVQTLPIAQEEADRMTESRILSDAELIKMGAEIVGGVLSITPEQIEELAKEGPVESVVDSITLDDKTESSSVQLDPEAAEQDETQEKIDKWLDTMPATVHTWVKRDPNIPREFMGGSYGNSFATLASQPRAGRANHALGKLHTLEQVSKELAARGVSEAVTFAPLSGAKFGEFSKDSPAGQEEVVQVLYETLKLFGGNSGNLVRLRMMLPKPEADQLRAMMDKQPDIMRKLLETVMTEKFQAKEAWENSRPPYEAWKEANGGISRIAIRNGLMASAEDSKIIEF